MAWDGQHEHQPLHAKAGRRRMASIPQDAPRKGVEGGGRGRTDVTPYLQQLDARGLAGP
jgi:hypothetical protein